MLLHVELEVVAGTVVERVAFVVLEEDRAILAGWEAPTQILLLGYNPVMAKLSLAIIN